MLESLANVLSLRVLQGNCPRGFRFGGALQVRERRVQNVPLRQDYAPLDEILQLANVPRPGMTYKSLHYCGGNFVDPLAHLVGEYFHEVHNEEWDVLATVS
jgi:hypothetical protein